MARYKDYNYDKPGKTGRPRKSNVADNDSAKLKTSRGVIQGYDGVAAVDDKHQEIVAAEAFGEAQEHELLQPMLETTQENFAVLGEGNIYLYTKITADSGFHTERNAEYLHICRIDGCVADNRMRQRDPRFQDVGKYKALAREERRQWLGVRETFSNKDFRYDPAEHTCNCPAGKSLYSNGSNITINGYAAVRVTAPKSACRPCQLLPEIPRQNRSAPSVILRRRDARIGNLYPDHEAQDRLLSGQGHLQPKNSHGGTGLRPLAQYWSGSIHVAG